jgi:hypothetical protein
MSGAIQVARFLLGDRYDYDVGQTRQVLPQAPVTSIAQTPDGHLWLGAPVGLARFYGAQFKLIEEETPKRFGVRHLLVKGSSP